MKKKIPTGVIVAAIAGILMVMGAGIFFTLMKSDRASQGPNPPPTFNASQKEAEAAAPAPTMERGPGTASVPDQRPGPKVE